MPKRVILIDDDNSILFSLEAYLEDLGFEVFTASDGLEGINLIDSQEAELIITDMRMPKKNGIEVIQTVSLTNKKVPIIVLSGNGVAEDVIEALHAGAWDYILKPIRDFSILEITIERLLEKSELLKDKESYQRSLEKKVQEQTEELRQKNGELERYQIHLEEIIKERTAALSKSQNLLIDSAHKAGQADIAIDVIHNIGNSMNSINTAIYVLDNELKSLPADKLREACNLLIDNRNNLEDFLISQGKAESFINYLNIIKEDFVTTINKMEVNQNRIINKSEEVTSILNSYRKFIDDENISSITELNVIINNTLEIFKKSFEDNNIEITVEMKNKFFVKSSKEFFIDLLFKVLKSIIAAQAVQDQNKSIHIQLSANNEETSVTITGNHIQIAGTYLSAIFSETFNVQEQSVLVVDDSCKYCMLNWEIYGKKLTDHSLEYSLSIPSLVS